MKRNRETEFLSWPSSPRHQIFNPRAVNICSCVVVDNVADGKMEKSERPWLTPALSKAGRVLATSSHPIATSNHLRRSIHTKARKARKH